MIPEAFADSAPDDIGHCFSLFSFRGVCWGMLIGIFFPELGSSEGLACAFLGAGVDGAVLFCLEVLHCFGVQRFCLLFIVENFFRCVY